MKKTSKSIRLIFIAFMLVVMIGVPIFMTYYFSLNKNKETGMGVGADGVPIAQGVSNESQNNSTVNYARGPETLPSTTKGMESVTYTPDGNIHIIVNPTFDLSYEKLDVNAFDKKIKNNKEYRIVGLGDSIMQGYNVDDINSKFLSLIANNIASKLDSSVKVVSVNEGINGMTTDGLLFELYYDMYYKNGTDGLRYYYDVDMIQEVINADAIVINIGGNDTLLILIQTLIDSFNLPASVMQSFKSGNIGLLDIIELIIANKDININFSQLMNIDENGNSILSLALDNLKIKWDMIMKRIRELNPTAPISIVSCFNPYKALEGLIDNVLKMEEIGALIDELTYVSSTSNKYFYSYNQTHNNLYYIADISNEFAKYGLQLTNVNKFDFHPNEEGHKVIFNKNLGFINSLDLTAYALKQEGGKSAVAENIIAVEGNPWDSALEKQNKDVVDPSTEIESDVVNEEQFVDYDDTKIEELINRFKERFEKWKENIRKRP